jgi:hypothetical protein
MPDRLVALVWSETTVMLVRNYRDNHRDNDRPDPGLSRHRQYLTVSSFFSLAFIGNQLNELIKDFLIIFIGS